MTKATVNMNTERLKSRFWQNVIRSNKDYINSNKETNTDCFKILDIYPLKSRSKTSDMLKKRNQIESENTRTFEILCLHILAYKILFKMTRYKVAVLFQIDIRIDHVFHNIDSVLNCINSRVSPRMEIPGLCSPELCSFYLHQCLANRRNVVPYFGSVIDYFLPYVYRFYVKVKAAF